MNKQYKVLDPNGYHVFTFIEIAPDPSIERDDRMRIATNAGFVLETLIEYGWKIIKESPIVAQKGET